MARGALPSMPGNQTVCLKTQQALETTPAWNRGRSVGKGDIRPSALKAPVFGGVDGVGSAGRQAVDRVTRLVWVLLSMQAVRVVHAD